jgi:hypothetical protein
VAINVCLHALWWWTRYNLAEHSQLLSFYIPNFSYLDRHDQAVLAGKLDVPALQVHFFTKSQFSRYLSEAVATVALLRGLVAVC